MREKERLYALLVMCWSIPRVEQISKRKNLFEKKIYRSERETNENYFSVSLHQIEHQNEIVFDLKSRTPNVPKPECDKTKVLRIWIILYYHCAPFFICEKWNELILTCHGHFVCVCPYVCMCEKTKTKNRLQSGVQMYVLVPF